MTRAAPAFLPASALLAGTCLAWGLPFTSLVLVAALGGLGLALRRPSGNWIAWASVGMLNAAFQWVQPAHSGPALDPSRPVQAQVETVTHAFRAAFGWQALARVEVLRQGLALPAAPRVVWLELPFSVPRPVVGAHLHCKGYLSRSPGFANPAAAPAGSWRLRVKTAGLLKESELPGPVGRLSGALRRGAEASFCLASGRAGGALARAFVLGDESDVPEEWRRALRRSGLSHLLAVSGFNVTLLAGMIFFAAAWTGRSLRLLLVMAAIGCYLLLVGPLAPILRAALMGLLAAAALILKRPPHPANALAVTLACLLLAEPSIVAELAFQLTVAATAGILFLTPPFSRRWSGLPPWLARPLAATVAAELATLPWAMAAFHQISPFAPLLNLLYVPWAAVTMGVDCVWLALATLSPWLGSHSAAALDLVAAPFAWLTLPQASLWCVEPLSVSPVVAVVLTLGLGAALWWPRWGCAAAALLLCWMLARPGARAVLPELWMLDVGQGDCLLLRDGPAAALIDGGGWSSGDLGGRVLLPALGALGVRRLNALVLTHPDTDHCQGLVDIAGYLPAGEVWTVPGWRGAPCATNLLTRPGLGLKTLWRGETAAVGRWRLRALNPEAGARSGDNDRSLVLLAEVFGRRFLLTGDIESPAENRLVEQLGSELHASLLKVPHHGSRTSSSLPFLRAVHPGLALVSCGLKNRFGHPAPPVLDRLASLGIPVLRTDLVGAIGIEVTSDGRWRIHLPGVPR